MFEKRSGFDTVYRTTVLPKRGDQGSFTNFITNISLVTSTSVDESISAHVLTLAMFRRKKDSPWPGHDMRVSVIGCTNVSVLSFTLIVPEKSLQLVLPLARELLISKTTRGRLL